MENLCYNLKVGFITIHALNDLKYIFINFELQNLTEIHYCRFKLKIYVHVIKICLEVNLPN